VVNPVPVKQDKDWKLARDHSRPVNSNAIAPILTTINEIIRAAMNNIRFIVSSFSL